MIAITFVIGAEPETALRGFSVQLPESRVELVAVSVDWTSDYNVILGRENPIYYIDCASFLNHANVTLTHVQLLFAAVDKTGEVRRPALPLDIRPSARPGVVRSGRDTCRAHAYPNGERGFWLVAWVNEADFADGTSFHAPNEAQMAPLISAALANAR